MVLSREWRAARCLPHAMTPRGPRAQASEWRLALPLAAFFLLFFVAPLIVLAAVSLLTGLDSRTLSLVQYARFLGDRFSLGILLDTILLGAKATLVCLLLGLPFAWTCCRVRPALQSVLV